MRIASKINIISVIFILILIGCKESTEPNSPFITVVKLISAESMGELDQARKFIDIERAYGNEDMEAEELWKEQQQFFSSLANDKRFTNAFKYFEYDISEEVDGENAVVKFVPLNSNSSFHEIRYRLEHKNSEWVVIKIEYFKK